MVTKSAHRYNLQPLLVNTRPGGGTALNLQAGANELSINTWSVGGIAAKLLN